MSYFTSIKKNQSNQIVQDQIHSEPLITLNIKLGDNKYNQIDIFQDSIPDILATKFVAENNLELDYTEPIKQNIIKQMRIYDYQINQQLKSESGKQTSSNQSHFVTNIPQNKENKQQTLTQNEQTKVCKPEKHNLILQIQKQQAEQIQNVNLMKNKSQKTIQNPNISSMQYCFDQKQQNLKSRKINQGLQIKQLYSKNKNKISFQQIDQNQVQLTKNQDSVNISFSEEKDSFYTQAQIENSLGHLLKNSDERIINRLYIIIQTNKIVDPRKIPYEEFNYQLIVELRQHFQKHNYLCMNKEEFKQSVSKNHTLLKQAAIFFQI